MTRVITTFRFNRLAEIGRNLAQMLRVLQTGRGGLSSSIGRQIAQTGRSTLEATTPKRTSPRVRPESRRGYNAPIQKQWRINELISSASAYSATITNLAGNNPAGLVILRSLEEGAKPHRMPKTGTREVPYVFSGRFVAENAVPPSVRSVTTGRRVARSSVSFIGRQIGDSIIDSFLLASGKKQTIFATEINHPGMKGFRMVAETEKILKRLARDIGLEVSANMAAGLGSAIAVEKLK